MMKKLAILNLGAFLIAGSLQAQNCKDCSVIRSGYISLPLELTTGECAELTYGLSIAECTALKAKPKDGDGDGILDKDDSCPTIMGVASAKGCPDADGDGIKDSDDSCPQVAGLVDFKGCPDTDGDGITDAEDACPSEPGIPALKGCKDSDGDGIADKDDACPQIAGVSAFDGCKDTDGDGIADPKDKCPEVAGTAAMMGCKDSDNDGVSDIEDKCPSAPGLIANKGCPEIDTKTKETLRKALKGVQFETGKDVIKKTSFPILDNVVGILKEHSEYKLDIAGHTDNAGDHDKNVMLSEKRAAATKNYIISKGVEANRLRSEGYGPDRPIADNKTAAGKALNRRVEFIVEF